MWTWGPGLLVVIGGAAIAGGVGVGIYAHYGVVRDMALLAGGDHPDPTASERYNVYYELFKKTYDALER